MRLKTTQKKVVAFILLISCINLFMGCHRFFIPVKVNTPSLENKQTTLKNLSNEDRYFILRKGYHSYTLSNVILDQTKMTLTANVSGVPQEHQLYLQKRKPVYSYSKAKKEDVVLKEVHLFTGDTTSVDTATSYTVSLSDVQKIELIQFDQKRTTSSYVWGILGFTLGVGVIALIIASTIEPDPPPPTTGTVSSCPYISSFDGEKYNLQGEIYSAAIFPPLQKDDFLPMQIQDVKGDYCIKISNELQEIQHTDFADLMVVEHEKNVKVLMDPAGNIYSVDAPLLPDKALLNNNIDVTGELRKKDNNVCIFKDDDGSRLTEDLFITFKNDLKKNHGKLILSAKSSSWLNYVYQELIKGFGSHYYKWAKQQEKRPANDLEKWLNEQNIPLTVSVKTADGWKEVQKIKTIGPLLNRDVVIATDLPTDQSAEFKISGGYMFWELDYAAIDYSSNADYRVQSIKPYKAINEKGANVLPALLSADKIYLDQPNVGDAAIVKYKSITPKEGMTQTMFLHSSGYYKHIRNFTGTPKVAFLKSFKQPGALSAFSKQKFSESWKNIVASKN
jgi:hypothetical protein